MPWFRGLHESNSHLTVCVGFPRCQIWDSLRLLRLGKCWGPHGLDSLPRMTCMAQILRCQVRMGHRLTSSNSEVPFRDGKWKPCKIASSFGNPVHFKVRQSRRMGEGFLERLELLPDACLAARASGNLVAVFSNDRDYSMILHSWNLGREKPPASTQ